MAHPPVSPQEALRGLRPLGWAALVFAGMTSVVAIVTLWGVGATIFGPAPRIISPEEHTGELAKRYAASVDSWASQFDRRSLFFVPGAPTPPEPEAVVEPDRPPPPPSSYAGPTLIAMMNDTAFFQDGRRLVVGGERDGDLRVIRLKPPWEATLEWKGVEFAVPLFPRDSTVVQITPRQPETPPAPAAPPETEPPAPGAQPAPATPEPAVTPSEPNAPSEPTLPEQAPSAPATTGPQKDESR